MRLFYIFFISAEKICKYERVLVSSTDRLVAFRAQVSFFLKKRVKLFDAYDL